MLFVTWLLAAWLAVLSVLLPGRTGQLLPASDAEAEARARAIAWLHSQQLPDGSFGQKLPGGQSAGSPAATADTVYVLALLGEDPGGPAWTVGNHSAIDALAALGPDYARADPGQAGKVLRAVAVAGRDPRAFAGIDLVQLVQSFYDPATGRYHPELLYRHTLALEGLARAGIQVPPAALDALWQAQRPDGGWFWAFSGGESDLDTTGRVVEVLSTHSAARCAPALLPAIDYLRAHQDPSDGWGATTPPGPPNANSTAMATAALRAAGYDVNESPRQGHSPLASLLAFQEGSGAFVYMRQPGREEVRLAATIDALTALLPGPPPGQPCQLMYLPVLLAR